MFWLFTTVKFIHILLAIIAFGFNATYAIWITRAQRHPFVAIVLGYGIYTPTLSRQIRVLAKSGPESEAYRTLATRGTVVGITLAVLVLLILVLMVFKPTL